MLAEKSEKNGKGVLHTKRGKVYDIIEYVETEKLKHDLSDTSPAAKAFMEDEAIRKKAEEQSISYMTTVESREEAFNRKLWYAGFFVLGILAGQLLPLFADVYHELKAVLG